MENSNQDNSTEKLLNEIRANSHEIFEKTASDSSHQLGLPVDLKKYKKKNLKIGLFLTSSYMTFVLTGVKGLNRKKALIKWENTRIPDSLEVGSPEFPSFMESALREFTNGIKGICVWCVIDYDKFQVRNLKIPDVAKSKIANAAFWGFKKELAFDPDQEIFDFTIISDIKDQEVKKKNILGFTAKKSEVKFLENLFADSQFYLEGITSKPFAVQNFLFNGNLQVQESLYCIVNISERHTEIFCFSQQGILLVRNVRTGAYSLVEDFDELKGEKAFQYLNSLKDVKSPEFEKISYQCERLIGKITRTGDYCSQNLANNQSVKKFIFFGETDGCRAFMDFASQTIPSDIEKLKLVQDDLPTSIEIKLPEKAHERNFVVTAFGIALSCDDYTPNFIYTNDCKIKATRQNKINLAAATACIVILAVCSLFAGRQKIIKKKEQTRLDKIVQLQSKYKPQIKPESIIKMIDNAEVQIDRKREYASDYMVLAVVNEICSFTSGNIRIDHLMTDFNAQSQINEPKEDKVRKNSGLISLVGSIEKKETSLNSDFTQYILKLSNSRLFGNIKIRDKQKSKNRKGETLKFKIDLELI